MNKYIIILVILQLQVAFQVNISQEEYEAIIHKLKGLAILEEATPTFVLQPIYITEKNGNLIIPNTIDGTMTLGFIDYSIKIDLPVVKNTIKSKVSISPALVQDLKSFQGFGVDFNYNLNNLLGGGIFLDEWAELAPKFLDKILDYLDNIQ